MRPCTCDRVDVGHAYDPDAHCRTCWLFHHNPSSNAEWGGDGLVALVDGVAHVPTPRIHGVHPAAPTPATPPAPPLRPCAHLGGPTGELVPCGTCAGSVRLKLLACAVHGKCTVGKPLPGVACCETCPDNTGKPIVINHGAGGLGDALLASCAVAGLAKREPGRAIRYKVAPHALPFLELFDGGWYDLQPHDWDSGADVPPGAVHGEIQINRGYDIEFRSRCATLRVLRWANNLGGVAPVRPPLRDRAGLTASAPVEHRGAVVLAPFSTWKSREYPVGQWQAIERLLLEHGYRVLTLDARNPSYPDRHLQMRGEKLIDADARTVAGVLLGAACLVGCDSGPAHLGGILGVPTLVLCGQVRHRDIYAWYGPHVRALEGHMDCRGCYWQGPEYAAHRCEPCPNLASNTPEEVFAAVAAMIGPPRPDNRASTWHAMPGETGKAHARRLREGWYDRYVRAPCLDVGCGRDPLLTGFPVRRWDHILGDGDATTLEGVPAESFATLYASHVLEHVHDPVAALRRWYEVLAPGGRLIVCVPSRPLYEKKAAPPSRWNGDHKTFWEPETGGPEPTTRGLRQTVLEAIPGAEIVSLRVLDEGYDRNGDGHAGGEFSLEAVVKKPTPDDGVIRRAAARSTIGPDKMYVLRDLSCRTAHLPGDVAELGVYWGGSAKVLAHYNPATALHLFDTFAGMPETDAAPGGKHWKGSFADCDLESTRAFVDGPRAVYHVGVFPATAPDELRFRLVHVDCDIIQSVRAALDYFVPRMLPGGIMIFDDYHWPNCPGVALAIHERYEKVENPTPNQAVLRF